MSNQNAILYAQFDKVLEIDKKTKTGVRLYAMNEIELEDVLRKNIGAKFVFPRDILPQPIDGAYVVNTDPHYKSGQHWVAMYLNGGRGEYYESLGLPPMYEEFVDSLPKKWTFNSRTAQNVISE